jgi:putative transposase
MAEENAWGYIRIAGELKKLGLPPCPCRKGLSRKQFIQTHLEVPWAADYFTGEVWTCSGLVM